MEQLTSFDIHDRIYHTDNDLDIPTLDPRMQADIVPQPFKIWNFRRKAKHRMNNGGTYAFYTDDRAFASLVDMPEKLINSRCAVIIEPNFSTDDSMPFYDALQAIVKKRKLSVLCQQYYIKVLVDLYVVPAYRGLNLTGVPAGWRAYATRGNTERFQELQEEFDLACHHADSEDILFVVYGGGRKIQRWCRERPQVVHIPEMIDRFKLKKVPKTLKTAVGTITYYGWVGDDGTSH